MIVHSASELAGDVLNNRILRAVGTETTVLSMHAPRVDLTLDDGRAFLVAVWSGRLEVQLGTRTVSVDEDCWLSTGDSMGVKLRATADTHLTLVFFERGWAETVLRGLVTPEDYLVDRGEDSLTLPFVPHLFAHDRSVTTVLQFIRRHCESGVKEASWYEEQLGFLLERMLLSHRQLIARLRAIPARRVATRREILRRILLATDFIHASYSQPLSLRDIAGAACLSRHHFLRLFKCIHNVTPHEYLQRKRAIAAVRLLRQNSCGVEEVVRMVGFDSRSTLFRALRRFHGVTPRECRRNPELPAARPAFSGAAQLVAVSSGAG
ncbi:MAG TPA: AraC family transcriptional regulator [Steroidobacteraceae bacterium]|nr:AraC family transcriptional regulator [Steroidobacteraceae bacterium]